MLYLRTFGGLSVEVDGAPPGGAAQQRKPLALLGVLAAAGPRGISRDKLLAYLWPDADAEHARAALKQTCYALRRDLHAPDLFLGTTELGLNTAVIESDLQRFQQALERGDAARAFEAYAGPFLDGFHVRGVPEFEHWVDGERERLAAQACAAVEELARDAAARGDTAGAIAWWRRRAALDPISTQGALGLMRALAATGERAEAVRYGRMYQILVREQLDVEPAAEVAALTEELQRQTGERPPSAPGTPSGYRRASGAVPESLRRRPRPSIPVALGALVLVLGVVAVVVGDRSPGPNGAHLEAFRRGEQHLRRYALDSAIAAYADAIAADTGFAVALYRMGLAVSWSLDPELQANGFWERAGRHNHGLSLRDSLLIAGTTRLLAANGDPVRAAGMLVPLEEAVRRYPDDVDAWFALADARFHSGVRMTSARLLEAFDRAIALDSGFGLAYVHPVEIALSANDPEAARRYVRGFLAIPSVNADGAGMRLLDLLLDTDRNRRQEFKRALSSVASADLYRFAVALRAWPDPGETQIAVTRQLIVNRPGPVAVSDEVLRMMFEEALVYRGHLREASGHVTRLIGWPAYRQLGALEVIPADTIAASYGRWLALRRAPSCAVSMDAALWWASRRDTVILRRYAGAEDSLARAIASGTAAPGARAVPRFAHAALALGRGDTASALRGFLYEADPHCPADARQRREMQFLLTVATGRNLDAVWAFEHLRERRVPIMLERARLAERMGDREAAIHHYRFVEQAWLHADPELRPVVAEARAALRRLGAEEER